MHDPTTPRPGPPDALRWSVHPAARDPGRTAVLALVVLLAAALVWSASRSAVLTAAGTALLLGSLSAFFLPRRYELDAQGAAESGPLLRPRRLAWDRVRSVRRERHGIHISPLHRPTRWQPDRGLFLRTAGNAEAVARFASERASAAATDAA